MLCSTAPGVVFEDADALKVHYGSAWHAANCRRKAAGLPMLPLALFERVLRHAAALQDDGGDAVKSTAHLKADKRRRPAPRAR